VILKGRTFSYGVISPLFSHPESSFKAIRQRLPDPSQGVVSISDSVSGENELRFRE
jgi:hypothetical protein